MQLALPWNKVKPTPSVVVIGDIILDEYLFGNIERISPEAPVPVHAVKEIKYSCGGAANVALNIARAGGQVELIGRLAPDSGGQLLKEILLGEGVHLHHVLTQNQIPTTKKTRVLAKSHQVVRIDHEDTQPISDRQADAFVEKLATLKPNLIILSDYNKGVLTEYILSKILKFAEQSKIMTVVDPKGVDFNKYANAYLITPNHQEACLALGISNKNSYSDLELARMLTHKYNISNVLLTSGPRGMVWVSKDKVEYSLAAKAREVFDVTGAGDAVVAMMGLSLACGLSAKDAMMYANLSAGLVISKVGAYAPRASELEHELHIDQQSMGAQNSIRKIQNVDVLVQKLQSQMPRPKIVFTNGCFDILHVGHLRYLEAAKSLGEVLVVAINSDESVRRLKGTTRPFQSLLERQELLAGFSCVDYVISFEEDTPYKLIEMLKPDVLVKGGDWQVDKIVGSDIVKSYGGYVQSLPFVENKSTTNIVDKILKSKQNA